MARKGHGRPASLVQIAGSGTTYPDDGSSPVGSNEWNANRDTTGVIGFTKKTEAISSYAIDVTDSFIEVTNAGEIRTMDQITTALSTDYYPSDTSTKSFGEGDLLYLVKATAGHTITLKHQYGSSGGAGKITTLTGGDLLLDVNIPRIFMCRTISGVQEWIEYGGGTASDLDTTNFSAAALVTASDTIASNDNDTTIPTSAAVKDLIEAQIATEDTIAELNDTTISGIASGELLKWSGSAWVNQTLGEAGIQSTLSNSAIKTAYEANSDTNEFSDAEQTKLAGVEASATADQSNSEIAAAVEAASDSNTFADADHSKLNAIEASATADQTNAEIRTAVEAATDSNVFVDADHTKLNAIEALADVTDATNVNTAGAVMVSDASTAGMGFVIDEDAMGSNSDTKVPTQQSVIAYVASQLTSDIALKGDYNASTNSPDLDSSPSGIKLGDHYVVSVAGSLYAEALQAGDSIIAKRDDPTEIAHWITINNNIVAGTILRANLEADIINGDKLADDAVGAEHIADIAAVVEAASDSNTFTDADHSKLNAIEASSTADQSNAEIASAVEAASDSNTFTDADHTKLNGVAASANNYTHTTNADLTGEVTSSGSNATTITDNMVDEANLKITNAGNNGEYLQKSGSGGGLTWAAVSAGFVATANADLTFVDDYDIHALQRQCFKTKGTTFDSGSSIGVGGDNVDRSGETSIYVKVIDANNDGVFARIKKNGSITNLQIA